MGSLDLLFKKLKTSTTSGLGQPQYFLTRFMILRALGLVYFAAFLSLANQLRPLLGKDGLTPIIQYLPKVQWSAGSFVQAFWELPGLFWFCNSDPFLLSCAWVGVVLSLLLLMGFANGILMSILWILYMSFVHVGQDWYGYGWEIQLLETGFLSIFLVPLFDPRPFPKTPPPIQVIWLFRWLIFRIMIGSGLIKLRGDPCWKTLTCLKFFFETQPIPNPLSPYFHFMPLWFHKLGTLYNFIVELFAPWAILFGRRFRTLAGILMAAFQFMLILSGNLSFLNWLTLVPILSCLDDAFWAKVLPQPLVERARRSAVNAVPSKNSNLSAWVLTALVAILSIQPIANLLSSHQAMNTSFEPFDLVNSYGAFGSVGQERLQLVIEGTSDPALNKETKWVPYDLKAQPGNLYRRPCICSPYHYRLDWQIWFAAMSEPSQYPWVFHLVWKLLHNNPGTLGLLAGNPFPQAPPRFVRIRLFRYQFAPLNHPNGQWWTREELGLWLPPLSTDNKEFKRILRFYGWN